MRSIDFLLMNTLLVQSCSATKNKVEKPTPALEVYDGYFYQIIKKARRENQISSDIDLRILSAKHGLLHPMEDITYYDEKMTDAKAESLQDEVIHDLNREIEKNGYDYVVLNMGKSYLAAVDGLKQSVKPSVNVLKGDGIGEKGHTLKQLLHGQVGPIEV